MQREIASSSASTLSFRQFIDTCKSPATRRMYVNALHYFMDYLGLSTSTRDYDKLLKKDVKLIQLDISDFISHLRKKGNAAASVSLYIAAINKFYTMNDVTTLNWKKVKSFMGEHEKVAEDRPYTHSEIQTLIAHTTSRNRAIILLMSSAGLRLGAIPILRIKDVEPLDKYKIYKINVYAKSKKSAYFSFCTPECRKEIDSYLDYRRRWAERITDESPSFDQTTIFKRQLLLNRLQFIPLGTLWRIYWSVLDFGNCTQKER